LEVELSEQEQMATQAQAYGTRLDSASARPINNPYIKELYAALSKAQGQMEAASKDSKNPAFNSRYADLAAVWDAVREPLSKNGLAVIQHPVDAGDKRIGLVTILTHESGQSVRFEYSMPIGDRVTAQAVGSAITYARRYSLMAVCGIAPDDDDGNAASGKTTPSQSATGQSAAQPLDSAKVVAKFSDAKTEAERSKVREAVTASGAPNRADILKKLDAVIVAAGGK
jgi:hypothetical protein